MSLLDDEWILAFGFSPGPTEMLFILGIALLLYGGRLPEMARSWGKTLAEFRRGLSGIQSDLNDAMYTPPEQLDYNSDLPAPYSDDTVGAYRGEDEGLTGNGETVEEDSSDELPEEKPSTAETD